jgi:hypothetical protein
MRTFTGPHILIQHDGKIILVGDTPTGLTVTVARFTSAGKADGTLGTSGAATPVPGDIHGAALTPDGRLVIVGNTTDSTPHVARVLLSAPASIQGLIFNDLNGDGIRQPGEPALAGWNCFLDFNNNGQFDPGDIRVATNSSGVYQFNSLPAGTYHISQVPPTGWTRTTPLSPRSYTITVIAGQQVTGKNFGERASA